MMGAYQKGTDAQLDRAVAMQEQICSFLAQEEGQPVSLDASTTALAALIGDAAA